MPGGDGSGPMGIGAMTGRATGFCAGYNAPGYANQMQGRGSGMGFGGRGGGRGRGGGGRGRRNMYHATGLTGWQRAGFAQGAAAPMAAPLAAAPTKEQQVEMLKEQAESMGDVLKNIQNRIAELEKE